MVARSGWMSWVDEVELLSHRVGGAQLIWDMQRVTMGMPMAPVVVN